MKARSPLSMTGFFMFIFVALMTFTCQLYGASLSGGEGHLFSNDQIANAIYIEEGGAKTSHPYGILAHYKHTTPRQACLNTIIHACKDWDGKGDFIAFLGSRYCPVGAKNDPMGLNKNWVKNVRALCLQN